jgi:nitrogen-specific signal transduction histidine kinase
MSIMSAIVGEHHGVMEFHKSRLGGLEIDIFLPLKEI